MNLFPLRCLCYILAMIQRSPCLAGAGLRILLRKDSAVFRRDSVQLNCSEPICRGPFEHIYCGGPLIWAAWQFGLQKECPGPQLRFSPEIVLQNFEKAFDGEELRRDSFQRFCEENFDNRPYLETVRIPEWREKPKLLDRIKDLKIRYFAKQIHGIWPLLSKRFVDDLRRNPTRYPVVPVSNRFIVPASLFQVYYYWDSYWIIRGLLLSDLLDTARGMIENFGTVIKANGHLPNSGNVQYSRRSQPPLFTQMLFDYWLASNDSHFVGQQLGWAEKELDWWLQARTIRLPSIKRSEEGSASPTAMEYTLFQYRTKTNCPRPEGFLLDFQFAMDSGREDLEFFWSSTTSAAESGMDFSSRWFSTDNEDEELAFTRKGIETDNVLPVDLNVYMALNYRAMAQMHGCLGNQEKAKTFGQMAEQLVAAIDDVFRVPKGRRKGTNGVWFDLDLDQHRLRKRFYPTNIFPLLLLGPAGNGKGIPSSSIDADRESNCRRVMEFLRTTGALNFKGGLPSSMERNSVELWDFPIGWPPTTHFAVLSLLRCRTAETREAAKRIADGFLTTASNGLFHPRRGMPAQIWEKYDVRFDDGRPGFGADYLEQVGFGWTNGVLLDFIRLFHTDAGENNSHDSYWMPV